jgi:hypothetical protein
MNISTQWQTRPWLGDIQDQHGGRPGCELDSHGDSPSSRFRRPGTVQYVLGAQEICTTVNPYGRYSRGLGIIPGGRNRARRRQHRQHIGVLPAPSPEPARGAGPLESERRVRRG